MNTRRSTRSPLLTSLLIAVSAPAVLADTLIVTREGSGTSEDSAATVQFWSGEDRIARVDESGRMVADLSTGMLYLLNDQAGSCHAISTHDTGRDPASLKAAVDAVRFRRTGKSERIGDWEAEVLELTTGSGDDAMELLVWISDDIEVDAGQRAYTESVATPETVWMLALYDLGFPVRQEVRIGPMQMWAELQSIEEKPAPAGTYDVPAEYTGCDRGKR